MTALRDDVTQATLDRLTAEGRGLWLCEEASTLGLVRWPVTLRVAGQWWQRTVVMRDREGDVLQVEYVGPDGRRLVVFND